jgi:hypothetical protein
MPEVVKFWFAGQPEKTGPATSPGQGSLPTVTTNEQVAELPAASVAV